MPSRGIRNNNPGNIDHSPANQWLGELPVDTSIEPRFCRFEHATYGIRALSKVLLSYYRKYGLKTAAGLIGRWAPSRENDTSSYVDSVEAALADKGFVRGQVLPVDSVLVLGVLVRAIIRHENGSCPYDDHVIDGAVQSALA